MIIGMGQPERVNNLLIWFAFEFCEGKKTVGGRILDFETRFEDFVGIESIAQVRRRPLNIYF